MYQDGGVATLIRMNEQQTPATSTAQPNPVLEWSARVALVGLVGWFLLSVIGALTNSATLHAVGLLFAVIGLLGAAGMVVGWLGKKR
jgi:hypothetical protein